MNKHVYQKGFGAVEAVLIIVLVAALGFVGWRVYQANTAPQATTPQITTPDEFADWKIYSDTYISFKYPKDWTVTKDHGFKDLPGTYALNLTAPVDAALVAADTSHKNLHLGGTIVVAKDAKLTGPCVGCGKVFATERVATNNTEGYLVIADSGVPGEPAIIDLLKNKSDAGAANYNPTGMPVGFGYSVRVTADYRLKGDKLSLVGFKNVSDIEKSKQYIELRNLITTIDVKTENLPK